VFPETVLFVTVAVPSTSFPSPPPAFPATVVFITVNAPQEFAIPPTSPEVFPVTVLSMIVSSPPSFAESPLEMPPPTKSAVFSDTTQPASVNVP
jgi:hypothetical protein